MATKLQITGWRAKGLRCVDHGVNLARTAQRVYPAALIQMPNGHGKTTTLQLLRAALSGSAAGGAWTAEQVREMRKLHGGSDKGSFELFLLHNGKRLTIAMRFDFADGTVGYTTTLPSGMKRGFVPPVQLKRFLREDFVSLFVFDGELADRLLSREHTNAQRALEDLFQLSLFRDLEARVEDYWTQLVAGKTATESKGLNRRANRVARLRDRIRTLDRRRQKLLTERAQAQQSLEELTLRFSGQLAARDEYNEKHRRAEMALKDAEAEVSRLSQEVLGLAAKPHALSSVIARDVLTLKANLDRVKLPETAAREFFDELAEETECVCGRPLDDVTREAIRSRASRYLGSDDVALLNSLKSDISSLVGQNPEAAESELNERMNELKTAIRTAEEAKVERDLIRQEAAGSDPELKRIGEEIAALEDRLGNLDKDIERYADTTDSAGDEDTYGIDVLRRRLKDAERKLAEITNTLEAKQKTEVLRRILSDALARSRARLSEQVCRQANERIAALMPNNRIRVEKVDQCLVLRGQRGGSAGETLSIAYAFLSILFNQSDHQLPFIVDSPANPIDLEIRQNIGDLMPKLTKQFVAFVISAERQGFLEPLESSAQEHLHYITMFRKGPKAKQLEVAARKTAAYEETEDGIIVDGRDFFCQFQLDRE